MAGMMFSLASAARGLCRAKGAAIVDASGYATIALAPGEEDGGAQVAFAERELPVPEGPGELHLLEEPEREVWQPVLARCFPFAAAPVALQVLTDHGRRVGVLLLAGLPEAVLPEGRLAAGLDAIAGMAAAALVYEAESRFTEGTPGGRTHEPAVFEEAGRLVTVLADCAAIAAANARTYEQLRREAQRDALTGLCGHCHFHEYAAVEIERARFSGHPLSLLMVDLDNFRNVNEWLSYRVGDDVLREFARLLLSHTPHPEGVARYGGNQFALLVPGTGPAAAQTLAEDLRERIRTHRFQAIQAADPTLSLVLTASIGIATFPLDAPDVSGLVAAADRALLEAQRRGGDQVQAYPQAAAPAHESRWYSLLRKKVPGRSSEVLISTIRTLLAALEAKDSYTNSHSQAVALWSERIARCLDLPDEQVATVALGGLLHDIGKIGIPDAVLSKNGPLTPQEYVQIQEHPALGRAILENVAVAEDVVEIVLHHQERFDGKGYPGKLAGTAIPLGARIVAVADAFHSMTSRRPYRIARSAEAALGEIRHWAGIMFDPDVVHAFEKALRSGEGDAGSAVSEISAG